MRKYLALALMSFCMIAPISCYDDVTPYNACRTVGCQKVDYHGHTYIHFLNGWGAGDTVVHDPDCDLCEHRVDLEDVLQEMKRIALPQVDAHLIETFFEEVRRSFVMMQEVTEKSHKDKKKKKH